MSWLDRFLGREETRATIPGLDDPGLGWDPLDRHYATAHAPEQNATVAACITAISRTVATLPAYVYQTSGDARTESDTHPIARLIRNGANPSNTWPDLVEWIFRSVLRHGNAVCELQYDARGAITALLPIAWSAVTPSIVNGRMIYDVQQGTSRRRLLADDVFHLRDALDETGMVGVSVLARAGNVVQTALEADRHATALFRNSATSRGIVMLPKGMDSGEAKRLDAWFQAKHGGEQNAGRTIFLPAGIEFTAVSTSPVDSELLASRAFGVTEICRIFGVPPPIVQDYSRSTFTNSAQANSWWAQQTLAPWCAKFSAECQRSLFGAGSPYSLTIDLAGLLRGEYATRWQTEIAAYQAGLLTAEEIRSEEGYGPLPEKKPDAAD